METQNMVLLIIACLAGGYVFLRKAKEKRSVKNQNDLPPGDVGWWILLVTMMMSFSKFKDPDSLVSRLVSRYGATGIYKTLIDGVPGIVVCSPETCRRVLADEKNFKMSYPVRIRTQRRSRSFHNMSNAEHKYYRRLTSAVINGSDTLSMYIRRIEEVMTSSLEKWSSEGRPVKFQDVIKKPALQVLLPIICGDSKDDSVVERMINLFDEVRKGMSFPRINLPGFKYHRSVKAKGELREILMESLRLSRPNGGNTVSGEERSMMDILATSRSEDGQLMSDNDIHDILYMYLNAGYETTSSAIMMVLFYLHQNPDMLKKAKEEQVGLVKRRDSTQTGFSFNEMKQMDYLSKVIDEMLRFLSVCLFREATSDVTINGYLVPKGWKVIVWLRSVHTDPDTYEEPKEFNPWRWENLKRQAGSFMPFGAGSRFCPGSDLAKLEIYIFLHHFLLSYELDRINPGSPLIFLPGPYPADKFLVRFKRAKSTE